MTAVASRSSSSATATPRSKSSFSMMRSSSSIRLRNGACFSIALTTAHATMTEGEGASLPSLFLAASRASRIASQRASICKLAGTTRPSLRVIVAESAGSREFVLFPPRSTSPGLLREPTPQSQLPSVHRAPRLRSEWCRAPGRSRPCHRPRFSIRPSCRRTKIRSDKRPCRFRLRTRRRRVRCDRRAFSVAPPLWPNESLRP